MDRPVFNGDDPKIGIAEIIDQFYLSFPTIIDQVFGGLMQTIVKCGKCKFESITRCPFMTNSLQHKATLAKCLSDYFNEATIDDTYKCESCSKLSKAKKSHQIVKLPKISVFHIKRFDD